MAIVLFLIKAGQTENSLNFLGRALSKLAILANDIYGSDDGYIQESTACCRFWNP